MPKNKDRIFSEPTIPARTFFSRNRLWCAKPGERHIHWYMLTGIVRYASLEIHGGDFDSPGYEITSFPPGKKPDIHGF